MPTPGPEFDLTAWSESRGWPSTGTRFQQGTEFLDLQFKYGSGGGATYTSTARFLANGDLRVFGEFIIERGQIRSYGTMALTVYGSSSQDIVSFRNYDNVISGTGNKAGQNTERLRITSTGRLVGAAGQPIQIQGTKAQFYVDNAGTTVQWGEARYFGGARELQSTDGSTAQDLTLRAATLSFKVGSSPKSVSIDNVGNVSTEGYLVASVLPDPPTGTPPEGSMGFYYHTTTTKWRLAVYTSAGWKVVPLAAP